jgi:hypothetical protein
MADYPIVISITSLPSRIGRIRPCLESLLSGSVRPDKILIPLPAYSVRQGCTYSLPDFLRSDDFCNQIIEIVPVDRDWGPGTKLIGALNAIPPACYLVLADDDVQYRRNFIEGIINAQMRDHSASYSYYTYRAGGLTVGQGCDGFSFWSPNVFDVTSFAKKHVYETNLFFHDDFWISFYLASKGIRIKSLNALVDGTCTIYEMENGNEDSLRFLDGPLSRDFLQRKYLKRLLREVDMPVRRRFKMKISAVFDRIVAQPSQRVFRKLANAL